MENYVSREEFKEETNDIYGKLNKHDKQISVLETLVENLKGLPSAINNLEKTMALMGQNLENLNVKVDKVVQDGEESKEKELERQKEQEERLRELDDKSKVDLVEYAKDHWWAIITTIALALTWIEKF